MGFPRQEYWSGLPFPSLGDLSDSGIKPTSPALAGGFFYHWAAWEACQALTMSQTIPQSYMQDFVPFCQNSTMQFYLSIFNRFENWSIQRWGNMFKIIRVSSWWNWNLNPGHLDCRLALTTSPSVTLYVWSCASPKFLLLESEGLEIFCSMILSSSEIIRFMKVMSNKIIKHHQDTVNNLCLA